MQPRAGSPVEVEGYDVEVDDYSIVDGERTDDVDKAGGAAVLRGRVGGTAVQVTVSAASLRLALGQALMVLLDQQPDPSVETLTITGYVDSEIGRFTELHRVQEPPAQAAT